MAVSQPIPKTTTYNFVPALRSKLPLEEVGAARALLPVNGGDCETALEGFARGGIDAAKLAGQRQRERAEAFAKSWKDLMLCIKSKAHAVRAGAGG